MLGWFTLKTHRCSKMVLSIRIIWIVLCILLDLVLDGKWLGLTCLFATRMGRNIFTNQSFRWDLISDPNLNGGLVKLPFTLWHVWEIAYHRFIWHKLDTPIFSTHSELSLTAVAWNGGWSNSSVMFYCSEKTHFNQTASHLYKRCCLPKVCGLRGLNYSEIGCR